MSNLLTIEQSNEYERLTGLGWTESAALGRVKATMKVKGPRVSQRATIDHTTGDFRYWDTEAACYVTIGPKITGAFLLKNISRGLYVSQSNKVECKSFDGLKPFGDKKRSEKCGYMGSDGEFKSTCPLNEWSVHQERNVAPPCKLTNVVWVYSPDHDKIFSINLSNGKEQRPEIWGLDNQMDSNEFKNTPVYDIVIKATTEVRPNKLGKDYYIGKLQAVRVVKEPGKFKAKFKAASDFINGTSPAQPVEEKKVVDTSNAPDSKVVAEDDIPF